ncbi:unnamed protein product [Rotaria socialis]|uniref:Antistasin-like domain-containing protein n=1 Tax=Rotaria socialis TaxID=392032 RepID=A0A820ZF21_9BILA|nr:unnamed protein product [Rotaria socialis]CAF4559419.1 unnamed protein product [Rotaria socialis]
MRAKVFLFFFVITIVLCVWFMPTGTEALPYSRNGFGRCPPACSVYCPCGNVVDGNGCPICRCRPSNTCTGKHPNSFGRPSHVKTHIFH